MALIEHAAEPGEAANFGQVVANRPGQFLPVRWP